MSFEIIERITDEETGETEYFFSINGEVDESATCFEDQVIIRKQNTLNKIGSTDLKTLKKHFKKFSFKLHDIVTEWDAWVEIELGKPDYDLYPIKNHKDDSEIHVSIEIIVDAKNWNKHYSISVLEELYMKEGTTTLNAKYMEFPYGDAGQIGYLLTNIENENTTLNEIEVECKALYNSVSEKVLAKVPEKVAPDIFTTLFEFPEELKTACKQYLIYFAQFLADMGINASTSIKEEANKVLFTVVPEDGTDALDKIKEALNIYINAPANPDIDNQIATSSDVAALQWGANVSHLRGQVMLAQAAIQMKDATIEALQLSNYRLKEELGSANKLLENYESKKEEKILDGSVAIKKYDGKWFSLDLPEYIRRLKRFGKNKKT